jgi:hypothetical protein
VNGGLSDYSENALDGQPAIALFNQRDCETANGASGSTFDNGQLVMKELDIDLKLTAVKLREAE